MKRLYADDSADSRVKVGNRQAPLARNPRPKGGGFCISATEMRAVHSASVASRAECADGRDAANRVGDAFGERVSGAVRAADAEVMTEGCVPLL